MLLLMPFLFWTQWLKRFLLKKFFQHRKHSFEAEGKEIIRREFSFHRRREILKKNSRNFFPAQFFLGFTFQNTFPAPRPSSSCSQFTEIRIQKTTTTLFNRWEIKSNLTRWLHKCFFSWNERRERWDGVEDEEKLKNIEWEKSNQRNEKLRQKSFAYFRRKRKDVNEKRWDFYSSNSLLFPFRPEYREKRIEFTPTTTRHHYHWVVILPGG